MGVVYVCPLCGEFEGSLEDLEEHLQEYLLDEEVEEGVEVVVFVDEWGTPYAEFPEEIVGIEVRE